MPSKRWFSCQICEHSNPLNCKSPPEVWCLFVCYPVPHRHSCASWRTSERKRGIQERSWTHEMTMKKKMMMTMMTRRRRRTRRLMMMMMNDDDGNDNYATGGILVAASFWMEVLLTGFLDIWTTHGFTKHLYSTLRPCSGVLNRQCSTTFWLKNKYG